MDTISLTSTARSKQTQRHIAPTDLVKIILLVLLERESES